MSAARLLTRGLARQHAIGAGLGLSVGAGLALRQPKLRLDARAVPRPSSSSSEPSLTTRARTGLDAEMIQQLSGGSIAG